MRTYDRASYNVLRQQGSVRRGKLWWNSPRARLRCLVARPPKPNGLSLACGVAAIIGTLTVTLLAYLFLQPGQGGLLDAMTLEDGTELRLLQRGQASPFYDVDLYVKRPREKWGWFFVDKDEDSWKGRGKLIWESQRQTIGIYRGSKHIGEYSPAARTITLFRMAQPIRYASPGPPNPPY